MDFRRLHASPGFSGTPDGQKSSGCKKRRCGARVQRKKKADPKPVPPKKAEESSASGHVVSGKRKLAFSNPTKIFWPAEGFTKGDVLNYYRSVSKYLLPYLKD